MNKCLHSSFLCYVSAVWASGCGWGFESTGGSSDFCSVGAAWGSSSCFSPLGSDGEDSPSGPDSGGLSVWGFDSTGVDLEEDVGPPKTSGRSSSILVMSKLKSDQHEC